MFRLHLFGKPSNGYQRSLHIMRNAGERLADSGKIFGFLQSPYGSLALSQLPHAIDQQVDCLISD